MGTCHADIAVLGTALIKIIIIIIIMCKSFSWGGRV